MTQIEAIFNKTPKTILQLPDQTPTATLLAETGFIPIELVVKKKKIMHANRVLTKEKMGLIQLITKDKPPSCLMTINSVYPDKELLG